MGKSSKWNRMQQSSTTTTEAPAVKKYRYARRRVHIVYGIPAWRALAQTLT